MTNSFQPTWDLDVIFPGGSSSTEFQSYLNNVEEKLDNLSILTKNLDVTNGNLNVEQLIKVVNYLEQTTKQLRESSAFISCVSAQNVHDDRANLLVGKRSELSAKMNTVKTNFDQILVRVEDDAWGELINHSELEEVSFILTEYRNEAKDKLPLEQEVIINDLAIDGYQGWSQMYDTIVGKMNVHIKEDGDLKTYSVGQAVNLFNHPDHTIRKEAFEQLDKVWSDHEDFFGQTLNHLAGFRLQVYKHRKWKNILHEPLMINRMKQETLNMMWGTISKYKQPFVDFLNRKAELLGLNKLSIYDVEAPLTEFVNKLSYTEGAHFIIDHFREFSPKMADFSQMAFEKQWIEAEDRANKRPGGFCTSFPDSEQTRIFMTYSGTASNIATLAHELGHAYHQHVMNDIHGLNQGYAMNVAETASTFAEMIVADAAVKNAQSQEEKMTLLEDKIQRSVAFFMNIHARFIFEQQFYKERKNGLVPVQRLNELMVNAQKEAYGDVLKDYDPTFWASKLHFHITGVPFYNFPYTFGYLFSLGIYAYAQRQGESFEDEYIALLRDTGKMNVEDLAMKHLGVDLTKPDFWEHALQLCVQDVEEFLSL